MSLATDALALAHTCLADHFGQAASYTAPSEGATPVAITPVIDADPDEQALAMIDQIRRRLAIAMIKASEVATPVRQGKVTIPTGNWAGTWTITRVKPLTGGDHECHIQIVDSTSTKAENSGHNRPLV